MEVTLRKKALSDALARIQGIPDTKHSGTLRYLLLECNGTGARLTAIGSDVSASVHLQANAQEAGRVCLDAKWLRDTVKSLPDGSIILRSGEPEATLMCGNGECLIPTIAADDFPEHAVPESEKSILVQPSVLAEMVRRCAFAMSSDKHRLNLYGLFMKIGASKINEEEVRVEMVATDGHRLARLVRSAERGKGEPSWSGILHRRGVEMIRRFFAKEKGAIEIGFEKDRAVFRTAGGDCLVVNLVEEIYPDYPRALPDSYPFTCEVETDPLLRAVQLVTEEKKDPVHFMFRTPDALQVEGGDAKFSVRKNVQTGNPPNDILLAKGYVTDILQAFGTQRIRISAALEYQPVRFASDEVDDYEVFLMPMRMGGKP